MTARRGVGTQLVVALWCAVVAACTLDVAGEKRPGAGGEFVADGPRDQSNDPILSGSDGDESLSGGTDPGGPGAEPVGECDLTGVFAVQLRYLVSWDAASRGGGFAPLTSEGAGEVRLLSLAFLIHPGEQVSGAMDPCGVDLPEFQSGTRNEVYAPVVPEAAFESEAMPAWSVQARTPCANPGCAILSDEATAMLGVDPDDPVGEWPGYPPADDALSAWSDPDQDGFPGLTASFADERLPVDGLVGLGSRAESVALALQAQWALGGTFLDCDALEGPLEGRVDSLFAGCRVEGDGPCGDTQHDFLRDNLPRWQNGTGARFQMQRMDSAATCADVRALY